MATEDPEMLLGCTTHPLVLIDQQTVRIVFPALTGTPKLEVSPLAGEKPLQQCSLSHSTTPLN
jgi:hypothetical protein